jgi:hypothetical protein
MPATFSHPAAVLPLRRIRWLNFAALVIGSMSPDFGYFIGRGGGAAHTLAGSVLICVPSGAAVFVLFLLLRRSVCELLPMPHRGALLPLCDRLPPLKFWSVGSVAVSLLLGSWTHIAWDAFTHRPGFFVQLLPVLQTPFFTFGGTTFRGYYLLQHLSTVGGLAALVVVYWRWLAAQQPPVGPRESDRWRYVLWAAVLLLPLLIALPAAARFAEPYSGYHEVRVFMYRAVISYGSAFVPLVAAAAVAVAIRRRRAPREFG